MELADTSDSKSDGIGPSKPSHLGSSPSAPIIPDFIECPSCEAINGTEAIKELIKTEDIHNIVIDCDQCLAVFEIVEDGLKRIK